MQACPDDHGEVDVAYYFFDREQENNRADHALRAVLNQLIHRRKNDRRIMDISAILYQEKTDSGYLTASVEDVYLFLRLLLSHERQTVLVFDGIDESSDANILIKMLRGLQLSAYDCKFVLFSRPSIQLPAEFTAPSTAIHLGQSHNISDQKSWLRPRISELWEYGILSSQESSVDEVVENIVSRSDGMFLWTSLIAEYLDSAALSTNQKLDAIKNLNRLKGLDSLYDVIISSLIQNSHKQAQSNIIQIFLWVLGAYRPLSIEELQVAAAIRGKGPFDINDFIPNLDSRLGPISGALLELTPERHVRFIHLSVKEYLVSRATLIKQDASVRIFLCTTSESSLTQRIVCNLNLSLTS